MGYVIPLILLLLILGVIKEITTMRKWKREHEEILREMDELIEQESGYRDGKGV